jgi:hypothetical protein
MTTLTIDLADILDHKLQFGFTVPVSVDVDQLLEHADDDWEHELDLESLLAERRQAVVLLDASEVHDRHPHLTPDQAWDLVQIVRADFEAFVDDAIDDAVYFNFPTARMTLQTRLLNLRYSLNGRTDDLGRRLTHELAGLQRVFDKLPTTPDGTNPALEGSLAVALDDLETAARVAGGAV